MQLVLSVATADMAAQNSNSTLLLPSTTHVINFADSHDRAAFTAMSQMKEEPMDVDGYDVSNLDVNSFTVHLLSSALFANVKTNAIGPSRNFRNVASHPPSIDYGNDNL